MESIEKIKSTYSRIAEEAQQESNKIQQAIYHTGSLRLLLFVTGIAGIIYFREESWTILAGIALVPLLPFILLIKYHNNLFRRKDYQEKRAEVNRQELAALDYDTSCFDAGEEFVDPAHLYAYDLDVFGTHSLFQYVNRTCTEPGKRLLANWLGQHLEKKEDILERQAAVRELAPELQFRQHFRILGMLHKGTAADETELKAWAASPGVFRKNKFLRLLPATVTGINGICLLLMLTGYLPASMWGVIWTLFVTAGFAFTGKITKIQAVYGKKLQILGTYAGLLKLMEAQPMQCNLLKRIKEEIGGEQRKASLAISRLSKLMNELDQRNNVFMYVILNGLFFWELRQIMRIETWKEQYARELPHWLSALGQMDALNSLATFAYNHPDYSYPTLLDKADMIAAKVNISSNTKKADTENTGNNTRFMLRAKALGHPLMHRDRCVRNDIDMEKRPFFIIITGANMGGKSVAMKTVALNVLLLQSGFLVCARSARMPLFWSVHMLFDDLQSIQSGLSGFGSEIVQFQKALAEVEQGYSLFLLDEFARGTNPDEGAIIVQAVTRYLNDVNAISLLTTHYDKVAEHARVHYQIIGLRDVDPEQIRRELAATNEDGVAVIARHMNYGLYRVEGRSDCPRDALNICRMLSLKPEILEKIEQSY